MIIWNRKRNKIIGLMCNVCQHEHQLPREMGLGMSASLRQALSDEEGWFTYEDECGAVFDFCTANCRRTFMEVSGKGRIPRMK